MISVSENFAPVEHGYIADKLSSWIEIDIAWLKRNLEYYVETGDPKWIDEFNNKLSWMADPNGNIQRELRYIEERRRQAALV